jgi:hypothetical protein
VGGHDPLAIIGELPPQVFLLSKISLYCSFLCKRLLSKLFQSAPTTFSGLANASLTPLSPLLGSHLPLCMPTKRGALGSDPRAWRTAPRPLWRR